MQAIPPLDRLLLLAAILLPIHGSTALTAAVAAGRVEAQPSAAASEPVDPVAVPRLVRPGVYALGLVTLDQTNRTVRFPAAVNLRAGLVEYALVTTVGKVHESIFRTEAKPHDIHLAMLLLGVTPASTELLPENPSQALPGEPIAIEVRWRRGRREIRRPLEDLIRRPASTPKGNVQAWVYNGSFVVDGAFAAQSGGSIIALITDPSALVNNPRPDRADDEVHQARTSSLPREDTPVEIVFRVRAR